jgi:hypothetical protein
VASIATVICNAVPVVVGLAFTILVSRWTVAPLLDRVRRAMEEHVKPRNFPLPTMISEEVWRREILEPTKGGAELGYVESTILFAAFWVTNGWPLLVSWLGFKLASKWNTWTTLGEIPKRVREIKLIDDRQETTELQAEDERDLRARVYRTSQSHRVFVIGTGANIVIALGGVALGKMVGAWIGL